MLETLVRVFFIFNTLIKDRENPYQGPIYILSPFCHRKLSNLWMWQPVEMCSSWFVEVARFKFFYVLRAIFAILGPPLPPPLHHRVSTLVWQTSIEQGDRINTLPDLQWSDFSWPVFSNATKKEDITLEAVADYVFDPIRRKEFYLLNSFFWMMRRGLIDGTLDYQWFRVEKFMLGLWKVTQYFTSTIHY